MLYCPNCDEYYQDGDPRIEERNNMMLERCPVCGDPLECVDDEENEEEDGEQ